MQVVEMGCTAQVIKGFPFMDNFELNESTKKNLEAELEKWETCSGGSGGKTQTGWSKHLHLVTLSLKSQKTIADWMVNE